MWVGAKKQLPSIYLMRGITKDYFNAYVSHVWSEAIIKRLLRTNLAAEITIYRKWMINYLGGQGDGVGIGA